jgi:hypothetical protein
MVSMTAMQRAYGRAIIKRMGIWRKEQKKKYKPMKNPPRLDSQ